MKRPKKGEYAPFHDTYIGALPPRGTAQSLLRKSFRDISQRLAALSEEQANSAYAPGKWTVKEMVMHMIDTERVFAYRILSFMRGDRVALPGFNQDVWMEQVQVAQRSMKDLLKEWKAVRDNTLFLLSQCSEEQSKFMGTASNWKVSVRAYFYIVAGHQLHHMQVLRERYGV
ncbi:MAG TPA: DinB family protein [Saprospiraceae bacterium]|nr:DinB family protein [Saprospiraceae bacterium]HND89385.1 DinB family protein [Saprospiraceae bacterium]